jgi:ketosteroid isomerase-like protein
MGGCGLANPPGTVRREDGELNHAGDRKQTRTLAEHQDAAVHSGDTTGVLRDDAASIVMFDVPPPDEGASGIDAYSQTWPPLFRRQAQGALFQIASPDVQDSNDIACAHALLRCGEASMG